MADLTWKQIQTIRAAILTGGFVRPGASFRCVDPANPQVSFASNTITSLIAKGYLAFRKDRVMATEGGLSALPQGHRPEAWQVNDGAIADRRAAGGDQ